MLHTYEAVLQPGGQLQFLDASVAQTDKPRRVLVTFTDEAAPVETAASGAALSEPSLARDWLREEEDAAWAHLQAGR